MAAKGGAYFLSTLSASPRERRLAAVVLFLSLLVFAAVVPFAGLPLRPLTAFIPSYQSALIVIDLITAALLFSQYFSFRARALFVLACGYLFTALMTIAHALTFPGLFAPSGLLGAGPQSTAWLYMFWHGGFPLFVIGYALTGAVYGPPETIVSRPAVALLRALAAMLVVVIALTWLAVRGQDSLPAIMDGNHYTTSMIVVVGTVWLLCVLALALLWQRQPHSVLDLWLMVVMCAWLIDIALSAVLNHGRFDLGFYAGRVYGLLAASFVLLVLLIESGMLYRHLVQLTDALQRLTTTDALTGIANRRAFDGALEAEWQHAMRNGRPLALLMIDIDHFKRYNDSLGHVAGDQCLRAVAAALRAGAHRTIDLVARYGGEEFAVLLPQTELEAAAAVGERLRAAVESLAIPCTAMPAGRVTISVGVAAVREAAEGPVHDPSEARHLVERADRMLYAAKAAGRNRVAVEAPEAAVNPASPAPAH